MAASLTTIRDIVNQVAGIYEAQLGIRLYLAYQNGWDSAADPYPDIGTDALFDAASQVMARPEIRDRYGLGLMQAWVVGAGTLGGTVVGRSGYGACSHPSIVSKYGGTGAVNLSAHELGHDLYLDHDDTTSNIMRSVVSSALNFTTVHSSQVRATNYACFQPVTDEAALPGAPPRLSVRYPQLPNSPSGVDPAKLELSWDRAQVGGPVFRFQVFRSAASGACQGAPIAETQGNVWIDPSPPWGVPSYYSVRAVNAAGAGPCSPIASMPVPADVTISRGTRSSDSVTLVTAGTAALGQLGLYVWRGENGPAGAFAGIGEATLNPSINSEGRKSAQFVDAGAPADGTHRWYVVLACNISGCTSSATLEAFRFVKLLPPTNLVVFPGAAADRITLNFAGSAQRSASSYTIYRKLASASVFTQVAQLSTAQIPNERAITYEDRDIRVANPAGQDVQYYVIAKDEAGFSQFDSDPSVTVTSYTLAPPTGVNATLFSSSLSPGLRDSVRISWQATARGANGYVIERAPENPPDASFEWIAQTGINLPGLVFDDSGVLANGLRYRYRVKSYNATAAAPSLPVLGSRDPRPLLVSSPADRTVTAGDSWTFSAAFSSAGPLTYRWYRNNILIPNSSSSSLMVSNVGNADDGARYHASAVAYGLAFDTYSMQSAPATLSVNAWLGGLTASDGASTSFVNLTWVPIVISRVVGYDLFRSTINQGCQGTPAISVNSNSAASVADSSASLVPGVNYFYSGRPRYSGGVPGICGGTDVGYMQLSAPSFSASPNSATGEIVLSKPANVNGATSYFVYRSTDSALTCAGTPHATLGIFTSYSDPLVSPGMNYFYRMQARGANGSLGACSSLVSVALPLGAPSLQSVPQQFADKVRLTWNAVPFANSYLIYRSTTNTPCSNELTSTGATILDDSNVVPGGTYYYSAKSVTPGGLISACSPVVVGTVDLLPVISTQPSDAYVSAAGTSATFTVVATSPRPIRYQWYKNDQPLSGETTSSLFRSNIQLSDDQSSYYARLTTSQVNYVQTRAARLTIRQPVASVTATDGTIADGVDITWSSAPYAVSYSLYRALSSGATCAASSRIAQGLTEARFFDSTADAGITYFYRVGAVYANGSESSCSVSEPGSRGIGQTSGIVGFNASLGLFTDEIALSWDIPQQTGISSVEIFRASSAAESCVGTAFRTLTGRILQWDDTAPSPGVDYFYSARILYSNSSVGACSPVVRGYRRLSAPSFSASSNRASLVNLALSTSVGAVATKIYRNTSSTTCLEPSYREIAGTPPSSIDDGGAEPGLPYYYSIQFVGANGAPSSCSAVQSGVALPAAITGISASNKHFLDRIELVWPVQPRASSYRITNAPGCTGAAVSVSEPRFVDSGLAPGSTRTYYVQTVIAPSYLGACSARADGFTDVSPLITNQPSDSPEILEGQPVSFQVSASAAPYAPLYQWYRSGAPVPGEAGSRIALSSTGEGDDGATFFVRVSAGGAQFLDSRIARLAVLTPPRDLAYFPDAPARRISLSWSSQARQTSFLVYRSNSPGERCIGTPLDISTSTSFVDSGPVPGERYYYSLQGRTASGATSACSEILAASLVPPTPTPTATATLTATATATSSATPTNSPTVTTTSNPGASPTALVPPTATSISPIPPTAPPPTPTSGPVGSPTPDITTEGGRLAQIGLLKCRLTATSKTSLRVALIDAAGVAANVVPLRLTRISAKLRLPDQSSVTALIPARKPLKKFKSLSSGKYSAKIQMFYGKRKFTRTCNKLQLKK